MPKGQFLRVEFELTSTDRPLGAIFNSRMHTTGLRPGGRMQMRTVSGDLTIRGNRFRGIPADGIQLGTVAETLIEGNEFTDVADHLELRGLRPLARASRLACVAAAASPGG